jgi:hypothetical protein
MDRGRSDEMRAWSLIHVGTVSRPSIDGHTGELPVPTTRSS